jgi:uncharacterized protein (UPF0335 family)
MTDTHAITAAELEAFVERIEAQNARIADETEARKEIFAEAKGRGYDPAILRKIVAMRKRKPDEIAEEQAVMEAYLLALGMV